MNCPGSKREPCCRRCGIMKEDSAMNTLASVQPSQEITEVSPDRESSVWPGCDVLDVCGPIDVFFYAKYWLQRFGRISEPGYQCDIVAATTGPIKTTCGNGLIATHSYSDIEDDLAGRGGGAVPKRLVRIRPLSNAHVRWRPGRGAWRRFAPALLSGGQRAPSVSQARDDALDVFGDPRGGIPFD